MVILNKSDYLAELNRLVYDAETHEKLGGNPTNKFKAKLRRLIKNAQDEGILTKNETRYLVPDAPRVPVIYQLHHCPAYLRDSGNLMELLQQLEVDDGHILASIDINSLYTNIQQKYAVEAVVWALNNTTMKNKQKDFLVHALDLAMSLNFFCHDK